MIISSIRRKLLSKLSIFIRTSSYSILYSILKCTITCLQISHMRRNLTSNKISIRLSDCVCEYTMYVLLIYFIVSHYIFRYRSIRIIIQNHSSLSSCCGIIIVILACHNMYECVCVCVCLILHLVGRKYCKCSAVFVSQC